MMKGVPRDRSSWGPSWLGSCLVSGESGARYPACGLVVVPGQPAMQA